MNSSCMKVVFLYETLQIWQTELFVWAYRGFSEPSDRQPSMCKSPQSGGPYPRVPWPLLWQPTPLVSSRPRRMKLRSVIAYPRDLPPAQDRAACPLYLRPPPLLIPSRLAIRIEIRHWASRFDIRHVMVATSWGTRRRDVFPVRLGSRLAHA